MARAQASTRDYIRSRAASLGAKQATVLATLRYNLPATYAFHKQASKDIEVDLWALEMQ